MKTTLLNFKTAVFFGFSIILGATSLGQSCPLGNSYGQAVAPTVVGQTQAISSCSFLGEYSTVTNLDSASTYLINMASNNGAVGNYFVTVYEVNSSVPVTSGPIPFSFSPANSGNYWFQWNGPNCLVQSGCLVSSITLEASNAASCNSVTGGLAQSLTANACLNVPFMLNLVNASAGVGISYQWQSSSDGISFSNIPGEVFATANVMQSTTTWYQCVVTCSNGTSSNSSSVQIAMNSTLNCYCTSQANMSQDTEILSVSLASLNNVSGCGITGGAGSVAGMYSDFTNLQATPLTLGSSNQMSVSVTMCGAANFMNSAKAWIDWNQDGVFDVTTEQVFTSINAVNGPNTIVGTVNVPLNANLGLTRMRVVCRETSNVASITPCGTYTWGETEDYAILVTDDNSFACINGSVFCDNNDDGILDSSDVALGYAPFILNYNGQTQITNADVNGYFFFGIPLDSNATSATVTVDPAWLAQNGIQYTTNSITTTNLVCNANSPTLNFAVNCDSSDIQSSCIIGLVYCDANLNDSLDSGEVVIPFAPVVLENGVTVYTDSLGVFSYSGGQNPSGMMGVSISSSWLATNGYELLNNNFEVSTDCSSPVPLNIGINCSPVLCSNLWTTVTPWIGYFQNQNNQIRLSWGNYGPNMTSGFTLTLTFPTDVTPVLSSISNPNYSISGNTISWTYPAGNYSSYNTDIISFYVPPIFPSGTAHTYTSTIDARGAVADCDTTNNDGMLTMILGNSYDPNDKSVSHPPMISPDEDEELTYVIRFQNTGTAPAQDVYILDTLSSFLDWSSLKVINASHYMQLVDLGNGVVKFNFPGIWLPDSTSNEPASHGRVVFSIKENAFNPLNSVIENTGYIYFDWNEAIITNTTYNINAYPVSGIDELSGNQVNIYPNPFNGTVNVLSSKLMESIKVLDVTGHEVYFEAVNAVNQSIDLSKLSQGVYLVEVNSGGEISTQRIIKK